MTKMLYTSTLALVDALDRPRKYYETYISQCLHATMPHGRLDIYVLRTPRSLAELEHTVRELYAIAREQRLLAEEPHRKSIDVTVLIDGLDIEKKRSQKWEVIVCPRFSFKLPKLFRSLMADSAVIQTLPVVFIRCHENDEEEDEEESSIDAHGQYEDGQSRGGVDRESIACAQYGTVAVGGTFDHIHEGHKLLLTIAGYLARDCLIIGITGPELLKNKEYAEAMQSYARRKESVMTFMNYVFPSLYLHIEMINDVFGPTATIEDIQALVVSAETRSGGQVINRFRTEKGWNELEVFEIQLIGGEDNKLSSTQLRKEEMAAKNATGTSQL